MPGPILTASATVQCAHFGNCTPINPMPRVLINGTPVVTLATTYSVAACQAPTLSGGNLPPCLTAQFSIAPATRVLTTAGPVLVASSNGTTIPNGTPMVVTPNQVKVIAT